jgi:propionate catabolism operon transcriptional regulator
MESMIKILVIVPYVELQSVVDDHLRLIDGDGLDIQTVHIFGTDKKKICALDADIIVARGLTAKAIARLRPDVHVIPIPMGIDDFLEALTYCKQQYAGKNLAVVSADSLAEVYGDLPFLIGEKISCSVVKDEESLGPSVEKLRSFGAEVFVGGLTLCRYCEAKKYPYVHIKTCRTTMEKAIDAAVDAGRSLERTMSRTNLLAILLNNSQDAIVAVNAGGCIIECNKEAESLFGVSVRKVGLESQYPHGNWEGSLVSNLRIEMIQTVCGQQMLVTQQPLQGIGVLLTFQNIERIQKIEQKIRTKLTQKGLAAKYTFKDILTQDSKMQSLAAKAHRYSQVEESVLLIGESGTGKELFAQSIHNASKRAEGPFVAINCAALPENLLESELFGYEDGAFSGARKGGKSGLFELAHGGTLFLDEIGEMSISLQAKLLRVLQEKEIRKVGGDTIVPVDVRIISATNVNIRDKVQSGEFRLDLFYRISLLSIHLLPLREHLDDIPILFDSFVKNYCAQHSFRIPNILPEAYVLLQSYTWPGNTRELRNYAERLAILNSSPVVGVQEIKELDIETTSVTERPRKEVPEEQSLAAKLRESGLSQAEFARREGISRTTLWRKLREVQ